MFLTRASVIKVVDKTKVEIFVPIFKRDDSYTSSIATLSTLSGLDTTYSPGDAVFVSIEDYEIAKPVILGKLQVSSKDKEVPLTKATLASLTVDATTVLPKDTTIGNITKEEISYLSKLRSNVQGQIDLTHTDIKGILSHMVRKFDSFCKDFAIPEE
jgi:hypothetical protein